MRNEQTIMMISAVHVWTDTRIYFKEAQSLAQAGHRVIFYAQDFKSPKPDDVNLEMHYLPKRRRFMRWRHWWTLYHAYDQQPVTWLHIHDPELLVVGWLLKWRFGDRLNIVYDMHEHLPAAILTKPWIPHGLRRLAASLFAKIEKGLMKSCHTVIFAEIAYKQYYQTLNLKKVDVLNYPLKTPRKPSDKQPQAPFILVYVGVLTAQRGLDNMLNALDVLVNQMALNVQLKLVGPLNDDERRLAKLISTKHLGANCQLTGRLPYDALEAIYQSADIGLCLLTPTPNNVNSVSTKLFEYMAASLPIVASDFQNFKSLFQQYPCGVVVKPDDAQVVANLIKAMLIAPKRRKQYGETGRKAFEQVFNWESEAQKLLAIYQDNR
ncbi:glycosyltransferase family 4 protein [Latilactobacillus graminis]|nr:glycosyltransferase family 4 protein [Latilactobacillus graminis]